MAAATRKRLRENKFQSALEYLSEYRGVKGAAILDDEGLVVARIGRKEFEADLVSPLIHLILIQTNLVLNRLNVDAAQAITIRTKTSRITITRVEGLILCVFAESGTDQLLKVRIGQAVDMIRTHLSNSYALAKS